MGPLDDFDPRTYGRDVTRDSTADWPLRQILELGGVTVLEHRWPGRLWEMSEIQRSFDQTELNALNLAGSNSPILNLTHSGGSFVDERLFYHIKPGVNTPITEAINKKRIKIITLNSFSTVDWSRIDGDFQNIVNVNDFSFISAYNSDPVGLLTLGLAYPLFNTHHTYYFGSAKYHASFMDPRVINTTVHTVLPNTQNQQIDRMFTIQPDINQWFYSPKFGYGLKAPPDYYLRQSQTPQLPQMFESSRTLGIDNWGSSWLRQNNFRSSAPQNYRNQQIYQQPKIDAPRYTPPPPSSNRK